MSKHHEYLAAHVLNEREPITYRLLSRELKVHVNLAKQMLWDFHHRENAKKPGSVNATYLLSGRRRVDTSNTNGRPYSSEDTNMRSSPPIPSSSVPMSDAETGNATISKRSILLVREEHLETARQSFEELSSIHVYSVQASTLTDLQALTACTRKIAALLRTEDNMQTWKQYGTIHNPGATRRTRKTPLPPAASIAAPKVAVPSKEVAKPVKANVDAGKKGMATKAASMKRENSGIAASFAKGVNNPKTASGQNSAAPSPAPSKATTEQEDVNMAGFSDDEPNIDDEDDDIDVGEAAAGKSKKDRQAELEAMMDVDEETKEEDDSNPLEEAPAPTVPEPEPVSDVVVENGRRRGRRRVTKKKTVRDEEGYLVTKEEAAWESFSEEEPAPKKVKTSAPAAALVKKGAKPGQGNIMSFFSKK